MSLAVKLVQEIACRFRRRDRVSRHLIKATAGAHVLEVVQTVSAHSIEQDEALHKGCFIVTALSLLDLHMSRHVLRCFQ